MVWIATTDEVDFIHSGDFSAINDNMVDVVSAASTIRVEESETFPLIQEWQVRVINFLASNKHYILKALKLDLIFNNDFVHVV